MGGDHVRVCAMIEPVAGPLPRRGRGKVYVWAYVCIVCASARMHGRVGARVRACVRVKV